MDTSDHSVAVVGVQVSEAVIADVLVLVVARDVVVHGGHPSSPGVELLQLG